MDQNAPGQRRPVLVVPAAQSTVPEEPQALLHVWVDAGPDVSSRPIDDPTYQMTIPSSFPELVTFIEKICNHLTTDTLNENAPSNGSMPKTTKNASRPNASSQAHQISQQLDDEVHANEDSDMDDISKSGSTIDQSAESSLQVDKQSTQDGSLAPKTPRGSKWGFKGLFQPFQSARSITRYLGFNPLNPNSKSPEPSPQMTGGTNY